MSTLVGRADANDAVARCGYPTKDGHPCRNRVAAEGKVCRTHVKPVLLDRLLSGHRRSSQDADGGDGTG